MTFQSKLFMHILYTNIYLIYTNIAIDFKIYVASCLFVKLSVFSFNISLSVIFPY